MLTPFLNEWDGTECYVKNRYIFAKFIIALITLAVKSSWVGGDRYIFMSIFSADDLSFAAAL